MKTPASLALLVAVVLMVSGCGSNYKNVEGVQTYIYNLRATASPSHTFDRAVPSDSPELTMRALLEKSGIQYQSQMRDREMITEMNGVISTGSKGWHLYINGKKHTPLTFDAVIISPKDDVAWRYESVNSEQ